MANELTVASSTDSKSVIEGAARNDKQAARQADSQFIVEQEGAISYEAERSERKMLQERMELEDAEKDVEAAVDSVTIQTNDPVESSEAQSEHGESPADVPAESANWVREQVPPDHEHWQRMKETEEFYGRARVMQIHQAYEQAGVDLLPGLAKQVADLSNSAHVVLALMREPSAIAYLNELAETKPGQAERDLQKISAWLAGELEEQKAAKPGPPPPIRPLCGSSTKSSVPIDEAPYQEFKRVREQQLKNRYRR